MSLPRFVVVGGVCAVLSNIAVIVLVPAGFGIVTASLISFAPVLLVGYVLHTTFTFRRGPSWGSFARYSLGVAANFPIWVSALYVLCDLLKISITIAAPATTALLFLWNYLSGVWAFAAPRVTHDLRPGE